jgi:hypothetical protein
MRWFAKADPSLIWSNPRQEKKLGILSRVIAVLGWSALIVFCCLYYYWSTHLPSPGQAVLVIGIVAALMALDMKEPFKAASIVLIFALAFLENKSLVSDQLKAQKQARDLWEMANKTSHTSEHNLTLAMQIDEKSGQILEAEKKHDPTETAKLRADLKALEKQRLLEVAVELREEMRQASAAWAQADYLLQYDTRETRGTPEGLALYTQERNVLNTNETQRNASLLERADKVRAGLLLLVPSRDDKSRDAIYAKALAGQPLNWDDMGKAADYLDGLYFTAIK